MRRIAVWCLALAVTVALGSLAATREPRSAVIEAAPSQNPQPVMVTNFPTTQGVTGTVAIGNLPAVQNIAGTVNVGNLPAVQNVAGTVAVTNLPTVQAVAGTVAVGNLPLDANGNLKVAAASSQEQRNLFVKVVDTLLSGQPKHRRQRRIQWPAGATCKYSSGPISCPGIPHA